MPDLKTMELASCKLGEFYPLKKVWGYSILVFVSLGFLLSVTQIFGESPDYSQYDDFFDLVRSENLDVLVVSRFEPGFSIFTLVLTTLLTTNVVVYSWIVAAALLLKGWAIHACSSSRKIFIIVAAFYLVRYFPLHELTQLRAACAFGLLMVAATLLWNGNRLSGILACAAAVMFHMSAAIAIPALFLLSIKRWLVIVIGVGIFALVSSGVSVASNYLANYITVLAGYQAAGFGDWAPHPFAIPLLVDWAMITVSLIMWNRLSLLMKRVILVEVIGMAIFYALLDFPAFASRMREVHSIFWLFFIADGLESKRIRTPIVGFVAMSVVVYGYVYFIKGDFFT